MNKYVVLSVAMLGLTVSCHAAAATINARQEILNRLSAKYPGDGGWVYYRNTFSATADGSLILAPATSEGAVQVHQEIYRFANCTDTAIRVSTDVPNTVTGHQSYSVNIAVSTGMGISFQVPPNTINFSFAQAIPTENEIAERDGPDEILAGGGSVHVDQKVPAGVALIITTEKDVFYSSQPFTGSLMIDGQVIYFPHVIVAGTAFQNQNLHDILTGAERTIVASGKLISPTATEIPVSLVKESTVNHPEWCTYPPHLVHVTPRDFQKPDPNLYKNIHESK